MPTKSNRGTGEDDRQEPGDHSEDSAQTGGATGGACLAWFLVRPERGLHHQRCERERAPPFTSPDEAPVPQEESRKAVKDATATMDRKINTGDNTTACRLLFGGVVLRWSDGTRSRF